jgi:hypothetical protein
MSDTLREQVARAVWEAPSDDDLLSWGELDERTRESERRLADVVIGVVLGVVAGEIEARLIADPRTGGDAAVNIGIETSLAVVERHRR